ncbi:hypothetical protein KCU95_g12370, partial [Aureobasidium melanogenum]
MDPRINNPSAEDAPTNMQDIDTQNKQGSNNPSGPNDPADPGFFSLTLEERNNIYHQLLDPKGKKTLVIEPPNSLKAINKLLNVSPEVRTEVATLIAAETQALVQAGLYYDLKLEPHTVAIPSKPKKRKGKKSKKQDTTMTELTDDLKVWKMEIIVFTAEKYVRVKAQMDFKEKSVKVELPGFGASIFSSNYCDYLFEEFEEAFLKAMKTFTDKDGFDGFLFKDVPELLHKVEMPCPKRFWDYDELFGDEESDEWDEYDEYDDYYDDEENEGQDDFGEQNNEYSDEEDYYDEEGEDGEEDGEDGDVESGVAEGTGKMDGEDVKVKVEGVETDEKTKSEAIDAGA